ATFPLVAGVDEAVLLFDVVFFVVLTAVLLQGTTLGPVAHLAKVTVPIPNRAPAPLEAGEPLPDGTSLRQLEIPARSFGDGRALVELRLPERALLVLVDRDGTFIVPTGATRLAAGDNVLLLADDDTFRQARDRLTAPDEEPPGAR